MNGEYISRKGASLLGVVFSIHEVKEGYFLKFEVTALELDGGGVTWDYGFIPVRVTGDSPTSIATEGISDVVL